MSKSSQKIFLTTDILYTIFSNLKRQDDIYSLLTVHSIWTEILIKNLWKSPLWTSTKSFACFIKTLQCPTPYFPYSTLIRNLSFTPHKNRDPPSFTQKDILFLAKICTNLTNLTVSWMQDPFNSHTFSQFLINSPNLKSIVAPSCTIEWLTNALNPIITNRSVRSLYHIELKNWSYETLETTVLLKKISLNCKNIKSISAPLLITKDIASIIISSYPQLEKFRCHSITNDGLKILVKGLRNLKELTLAFDNEDQDINDENTFHYAKDFSILEKFILTIGYDSNFPKFFNIFSSYQKNLKELELIHCFGLRDDSFIPIVKHCNSLESIKLKWCSQLTDSSYIALAEGRNQNLKKIFIFRSEITDIGLTHISENCSNLEILDLENCKWITLNSLVMIIRNCKKLRKLRGSLPESIAVGIIYEIIKNDDFKNEIINLLNEITNTFMINNDLIDLERRNVLKKNLRLRKKFNEKLLQELSKSCPNLRKLMIRNSKIENITGDKLINILHNFENLEKLCMIPSNLHRNHIKQLEKHSRLKEVLLIGGCTEKAERYIEENRNRKLFIKIMHTYGFLRF
ncbi:RNI-like protein [Rhizophagus irregularis]|uniref:RNI-like protein n=1 Tax=Rhizophagus irregularis TaxID=588596 RepID=A0A2N0R589_9GLOM|nr:RNI-like protein [Rhizophagus irregularis]